MTQNTDALMIAPGDEPTWKQRAVERSTRAAKLRAEQRVQRFLDAAQVIITEKGIDGSRVTIGRSSSDTAATVYFEMRKICDASCE